MQPRAVESDCGGFLERGPVPVNHVSACRRTNLIPPDPSPRKHWTKSLLNLAGFGITRETDQKNPIYLAVSEQNQRPKTKLVRNTIYGCEDDLPPNSFLRLNDDVAMSCPELLFVEMASVMDTPRLVLLGYELCGAFARDSDNPRNGDAVMYIDPVTSVERIAAYIDRAKRVRGRDKARFALDYVADNAWSPTEAIVATVIALPAGEFGYEMGRLNLNVRIQASGALARMNDCKSRVPDILFEGTNVGLNYDGAVHLDLKSIADAAMAVERYPGEALVQAALDETMRAVRAKVVDDIRRNRELSAEGYVIFPVTKEDLYEDGGLDRVMAQVMGALETFAHKDMSLQRRLLESTLIRTRRQELIWSLMPGSKALLPPRKIVWPGAPGRPPETFELAIGF